MNKILLDIMITTTIIVIAYLLYSSNQCHWSRIVMIICAGCMLVTRMWFNRLLILILGSSFGLENSYGFFRGIALGTAMSVLIASYLPEKKHLSSNRKSTAK
jgi:hypothetical protein